MEMHIKHYISLQAMAVCTSKVCMAALMPFQGGVEYTVCTIKFAGASVMLCSSISSAPVNSCHYFTHILQTMTHVHKLLDVLWQGSNTMDYELHHIMAYNLTKLGPVDIVCINLHA